MDVVRVLVVGEDPLARAGLAALVSSRPGLELAGHLSASSLASDPLEADVLLWDLGSARSETWRAPGSLLRPVVLLADDPQQASDALGSGARAVLPRSVDAERLEAALRAAALGLVILDPDLAGPLLRPRPRAELREPLTPRELEVLGLLSEGLSNKLIAARLGISEHTAKFHVNAILGKLGVESRAEAIVQGARLGLVVL